MIHSYDMPSVPPHIFILCFSINISIVWYVHVSWSPVSTNVFPWSDHECRRECSKTRLSDPFTSCVYSTWQLDFCLWSQYHMMCAPEVYCRPKSHLTWLWVSIAKFKWNDNTDHHSHPTRSSELTAWVTHVPWPSASPSWHVHLSLQPGTLTYSNLAISITWGVHQG